MPSLPSAADDTIRVLFIEDDPAVAEMYKLKLELDGYDVTIAPLGDQIEQIAGALEPELIFLDTQRHPDAGMTTLRALRRAAKTCGLPIIVLSSSHPRDLEASGFKANVMDYVVQADTALSSLSRDIEQWSTTLGTGLTA